MDANRDFEADMGHSMDATISLGLAGQCMAIVHFSHSNTCMWSQSSRYIDVIR